LQEKPTFGGTNHGLLMFPTYMIINIYIYDLLLLVTGLGSPSAFGQALGDGDGEREVICIHIYI
jgi:hypothetical protein